MKRTIFNVPHIFAIKSLFSEKNEIKWNRKDRHARGNFPQFKSSPIEWNKKHKHMMGSFSQFKSSLIKWNQTDNVFFGSQKVEILTHMMWNLGLVDKS